MLLPPPAILILDLVPTLTVLFPAMRLGLPLLSSLLLLKGPNSVELSKLILDDCFLPVRIYMDGLPVLC
jgi:hypothetical protein